jgi:hypothetical protein
MSSVVALVNDTILADGHTPLGFLNPWLYSEGSKPSPISCPVTMAAVAPLASRLLKGGML